MIKYFCDYCKKEVDAQDIIISGYDDREHLCKKCKAKEDMLRKTLTKEHSEWFTKRKAELIKEIFQDRGSGD